MRCSVSVGERVRDNQTRSSRVCRAFSLFTQVRTPERPQLLIAAGRSGIEAVGQQPQTRVKFAETPGRVRVCVCVQSSSFSLPWTLHTARSPGPRTLSSCSPRTPLTVRAHSFKKARVVAPLHTAGPVAPTPDGSRLVTCVGEDALLTDIKAGVEICRFAGVSRHVFALRSTPS